MANKTISLLMLQEIIRLKREGHTHSAIAEVLSTSRTTIIRYVGQIEHTGISYEELSQLSEKELYDLFGQTKPCINKSVRKEILSKNFPDYEKELLKTGVTRWTLWSEYKQAHGNGLGYTQFCHHFNEWRQSRDVYLHIEYKAGDKVLVDYAGKHLKYLNRDTGETVQLEIFIAILGASQKTYVEATQSQKLPDFLLSVENALWYFQGVPRAIVPDNLKSAVTRSSKYEPTLNEHFAGLARWYKTTVLPTRSYKPKDKALVEGAVKIVYHRIYAALRHRTFYSKTEVNQAIKQELKSYNAVLFKGRDYSREELFEQTDKPALQALPNERYPFYSYHLAKAQKNSHVYLGVDKHYYSIPYRYIGQRLRVVYSRQSVEIYDKTYTRIAVHQRSAKAYGYTTVKEHLPSSHQFVLDWSVEEFTARAEKSGPYVKELITKILQGKAHPEQGYKSCMGILQYAGKTGHERLNNACRRALYYQAFSYRAIRNILEKGMDSMPLPDQGQYHIPNHENQRGNQYYH